MKNTSQKILDKIKKEGIKPIPKWKFELKNVLVWSLFAISVILGSLAFSIIIFQIENTEWDLSSRLSIGRLPFILTVAPYFWIAVLLIFTIFAYIDIRNTKKGYKYKNFAIIGTSILFSAIIGSAAYASGLSEKIEDTLVNFKYYNQMHGLRHSIWARPEDGLLGGQIQEIVDANTIIIIDPKKNIWSVDTSNCIMKIPQPPRPKTRVKITGDVIKRGFFKAEEVRPWFKTDLILPPIDRRHP